MDSKLIQEIKDFKTPLLISRLKTNYNMLYWRVRKFAYDIPLKLVNNGKAEKSLVASSSLLCTCFMNPDCKYADRILLLVDVMCFYLFVEDYYGYDKTSKGFDGVLETINGIKKTGTKTPTEFFINTIIEKVKPVYTDVQLEFFREKIYEFVEYCKKEIEEPEKQFDCVEDIIKSRLNTNGAKPWYTLIDYCMGTDHSKFYRDKRLIRFVELMNTHTLYVNDIYSLKKECDKGELKFNTIYFFYRKGNSIEKSAKLVLNIIDKIEIEMLALKNELAVENKTDSDFLIVLDNIEYMAGGNLFWSLFAPRYNVYNKLAINDIFRDLDHFIELREEFDANTFEHIWNYTYA